MVSRAHVEQSSAAVVKFDTPLPIKALVWLRSWGRWFPIDPSASLEAPANEPLDLTNCVFMTGLPDEFVNAYFTQAHTIVSYTATLTNNATVPLTGQLNSGVKLVTPSQLAQSDLPESLKSALLQHLDEIKNLDVMPATWASSLPVGSVLVRPVGDGALYLVHLSGSTAGGRTSYFSILQGKDTLDIQLALALNSLKSPEPTSILSSWTEIGWIPGIFSRQVFVAFGWPAKDIGEPELRYSVLETTPPQEISTPVLVKNKRWNLLPSKYVFGEAYPVGAPPSGHTQHFPISSLTPHPGAFLAFGAGSMSIFKIPHLLDVGARLGVEATTVPGLMRFPYTRVYVDAVSSWLLMYSSNTVPEDPMPAINDKQYLAPYGQNLRRLRNLPAGTFVLVKYARGQYSLYVKLDDDLWYGAARDAVMSFSVIESLVNAGPFGRDTYFEVINPNKLKGHDEALELAKQVYKAYKDETKYLHTASIEASQQLAHWHELAHVGAPSDFVASAASLQDKDAPEASGRPWWLPPPGAVFRLRRPDGALAYLLIQKINDIVMAGKTLAVDAQAAWQNADGSWTTSPTQSLVNLVASLLCKSTTITDTKDALRLLKYDCRAFKTAFSLYEQLPLRTPKYSPCHLPSSSCFERGGHGRRFHPVGVPEHPVSKVEQEQAPFSFWNGPVPAKSWTTKNVLSRETPDGVEYLMMTDDSVKLFGPRGGLRRSFSYQVLDKLEGSYKEFHLADWGLNWSKEPVWYPRGSYLPGMPDAVLTASLNQCAIQATFAATYLNDSVYYGDILVQDRKSGRVFAVVTGMGIVTYTSSGESLDEEVWNGSTSATTFKRMWGISLKHLKRQQCPLLPGTKSGDCISADVLPGPYSALRHRMSLQQDQPQAWTMLPKPGTLYWYDTLKPKDIEHAPCLLVFTDNGYIVLQPDGRIVERTSFESNSEAYTFALTHGFVDSPAPAEVYEFEGQKVEVYGHQLAPKGLTPEVYNLVFAKDYPDLSPENLPKVGRLYRFENALVFNTGARIVLFFKESKHIIYLDDVSKADSELLAKYGFTQAPNATTDVEIPTIVLHDPGEYPSPDSLKDTGELLEGTYFKHSVLSDSDGNLWLWKRLDPKYHKFVVDAEETGSRISYMILGNKSVCAQKSTRDGTLGTLQPLLPKGSTLIGRDTPPSDLKPAQLIQLLQQHPVAWLVSDHDTHGNQFMITPDGFVVGLDRGQSFKHFGDTERLALDYWPNHDDKGQKGPYFYLIYPLIQSGALDKDEALAAIAQTVVRIKFADEAALLPSVTTLAKSRFSKESDQEAFINRFLDRKRNIDKQFDEFLSTALGSTISLRHYAKELKLANIQDLVFSFPNVEAAEVKIETIPAAYQDVEYKTKHDQIAANHGIKVVPHYSVDYLLAAMHNQKSNLQAFLSETNLKPIGNQDGGGFKKTPYGYMVAIHKLAYEKGEKVEVKKEIKTHAKTVIKAVHAKGELPPTVVVAEVEKGKAPLQIVDYVPLDFAFKGKNHNYEDISVIAQVPKFPRGGANIFLGSPYVINNYMNLIKVRVKDQFFYEVTLRVDQLLLNGLTGKYGQQTYAFHARDYLPEKGVYEENSDSKGALTFANFMAHHKLFEDDAEIWLFNDSVYTKFAMQGTIIIRIPVSRFNTGARMDKVLRSYLDEFKVSGPHIRIGTLGELIVSPTEDSLRRITLMKAMFSRLSWVARSKIDVYSDKAISAMEAALQKQGCSPTDLELAYLAEGHASTVHKNSGKQLYKSVSNLRTITHGGSKLHVASVLKHGLLSPVERSRRGVTGAGIVNQRDFLTGGAEMIMTMVGHMSKYAAHDEQVCYLISPNQLSRTDLYFHNSDQYGSINPSETSFLKSNPPVFDIIKSASSSWAYSNELIFWHSIPTTAILGVFCSSMASKNKVLQDLKAAKIEQVNGQPVSEFVRATKNYSEMTSITKAVVEAL